jgi:hypothetical protein
LIPFILIHFYDLFLEINPFTYKKNKNKEVNYFHVFLPCAILSELIQSLSGKKRKVVIKHEKKVSRIN